jgi:hypothetical protein
VENITTMVIYLVHTIKLLRRTIVDKLSFTESLLFLYFGAWAVFILGLGCIIGWILF